MPEITGIIKAISRKQTKTKGEKVGININNKWFNITPWDKLNKKKAIKGAEVMVKYTTSEEYGNNVNEIIILTPLEKMLDNPTVPVSPNGKTIDYTKRNSSIERQVALKAATELYVAQISTEIRKDKIVNVIEIIEWASIMYDEFLKKETKETPKEPIDEILNEPPELPEYDTFDFYVLEIGKLVKEKKYTEKQVKQLQEKIDALLNLKDEEVKLETVKKYYKKIKEK